MAGNTSCFKPASTGMGIRDLLCPRLSDSGHFRYKSAVHRYFWAAVCSVFSSLRDKRSNSTRPNSDGLVGQLRSKFVFNLYHVNYVFPATKSLIPLPSCLL